MKTKSYIDTRKVKKDGILWQEMEHQQLFAWALALTEKTEWLIRNNDCNKTVELQDQGNCCLNSSYNILWGYIPPLLLNLTKPKANFLAQY